MNDHESQPELDDELLSAYLDDELSPADRAAVESRLSQDSSARQLLHQLRAVSEAVQALPQEVVGHDMRESILRRAEPGTRPSAPATPRTAASELDPSNGRPTISVDAIPKLTIGRTKRAWIWAALAIAAALLIMVFQSEPERDKALPGLAQRDDKAIPESLGSRNLVVRTLNEPAAPAAAPQTADSPQSDLAWDRVETESAAAQPTSGAQAPPEVIGFGTATERAPRAQTTQPTAELSTRLEAYSESATPMRSGGEALKERGAERSSVDRVATATPSAEAPGLQSADEFGSATAGQPAAGLADEDQAAEDPLVVVRVLAKRSALESKTFDRLLERSGIELNSAADEAGKASVEELTSSARRFVENGQSSGTAEPAPGQPQDVATCDAVLVDAPPAAIAACLNGLNKDEQNYLGVAVDDTAATDTESPAVLAGDAKVMAKQKLADDLGLTKYNRGMVPEKRESITHKDYYYLSDGAYFAGGGLGGVSGADGGMQPMQQERLSRARKSLTESNKGLAVRLHGWAGEGPQPQQQTARGGLYTENDTATPALKLGELRRELSLAEQINENRLQVLFLFSCDDGAAPSPADQDGTQ